MTILPTPRRALVRTAIIGLPNAVSKAWMMGSMALCNDLPLDTEIEAWTACSACLGLLVLLSHGKGQSYRLYSLDFEKLIIHHPNAPESCFEHHTNRQ